ncbi:MAG: hypothetical protein LQ343_006845 [Gyalolechia ehrenbergii]|nr:MAG: hypothetical protein LQ343_006845 [Gyalolechia ehrenbergii]
MPAANGFFSGFMPVKPDAAMIPSYTIMVNDTSKPIWYYCSQGDHCQEGMVGVINPPAANQSRTIESFTALAKQAAENLSPGQSASASSSPDTGSASTAGSSGTNSYGFGGSGYSGPGSSGSSGSSSAAVPAAPAPSTGSTFTMPLAGTNSSTGTTGAATPSGSTGAQPPAPFLPGSGADALVSGMGIFGSLGLAGLVSLLVFGMF